MQQIKYTPSVDDVLALNLFLVSTARQKRSPLVYLWISLAIIMGVGLSWVFFAEFIRLPLPVKIVAIALFWGVVLRAIYIDIFKLPRMEYLLKQAGRNPKQRQALAERLPSQVCLIVTDDSISYVTDEDSLVFPWIEVDGVVAAGDNAFVRRSGGGALIIPKHAFDNDATFRDFIAIVSACHENQSRFHTVIGGSGAAMRDIVTPANAGFEDQSKNEA